MHIQDIEEMRRASGIDDPELRDQIRGLRRGDTVKITVLTEPAAAGETLRVRITGIRDGCFRGKLLTCPASAGLSTLGAGALVAFTAAHIHSLSNAPPARRRRQPH